MTQKEQQKAAKKFEEDWSGKGYEKGESQKFWIDLLCNVFGVQDFANFIFFEEQVKDKIQNKTITNFIDAYIPSTRVMIEQKSSHKDLREPIKQSDGTLLTPFQQAKKYVADLPLSQHPKWVVTCNFEEFLVYDMENPNAEPQQIFLKDIEKNYYLLQFLVDQKKQEFIEEEEISLKAGELVGKLYDALYKEYIAPDENSLKSLNILCVRIVFCLYAEDAGLFETKTSFEDYIKSFAIENLRKGMIDLFKALDTELKNRDKYDLKLKPFPYVNGGLFRDEQIEIPNFTQDIVDVIVNHCAPFNWSEISPTIFGAVFESTLNQETRRKGGMHYTSIQNIHKVIDPLFLDDLNAEFEDICEKTTAKTKIDKLNDFQTKLGSLKFLDPACGSGNFLTESYISLRRLENKVISILNKGERAFGFEDSIKVHINQFYGIEINDFAVTVAKTALWIAESQMVTETEAILSQNIDFLPLTTNAFIVEGNALRMDWSTLKPLDKTAMPKDGLFSGFTTETDGTKHEYNYIMGNPPFVGARLMSDSQKEDITNIFADVKGAGNIDYVGCWYVKAKELMKGTHTKAALVSTNSITQGEQTALLWKSLIEDGIKINFAYRTFQWDSESSLKAHVHCVIVGFGFDDNKNKTIYLNESQKIKARNINPYLIDAPDIFIESRKRPLCNVKEMVFGSMPNDSGYFILSEEDAADFIKKEPMAKKYIKLFLGAEEFINNKKRYCLWLKDAEPGDLRKMKLVAERVENVRKVRSESKRDATKKLADTPFLFGEIRQPEKGTYLLVPSTSSEKRRYIPMGFLSCDVISSNANLLIPEAGLYEFGIMTSNVHNAWMRAVCGRLEMRYRYSANIVYNNFPWCNPTDEQKKEIEKTAQAILDARAKHPDSSFADLYDETFMPSDLRKAHQANDRAVMAAYGFSTKMTESECVAELFKLYEKLTK